MNITIVIENGDAETQSTFHDFVSAIAYLNEVATAPAPAAAAAPASADQVAPAAAPAEAAPAADAPAA